jgi:ABC-type amino acid transport substrate-binding protein
MLRLWITAIVVMVLTSGSARTSAAELTEAERAYISRNQPFTYCIDPDWPPYEVISASGKHEGISADLLQMVARNVGIDLKLRSTRDWDETIALSKSGECQILSFLNRTPARDQWLSFTLPVFIDRNVIVTREEHPFIDDLGALAGKTLVLPKGTSIEERVRQDFPNLIILTTETEAEAFAMVSQRKADMTMRSLIVAVYTIKKEGWFNLKISGQVPGYENNLRIGVIKQNEMLRNILDKGVAEIIPSQRSEIANRHVSINVQSGIDYELIAKIVVAFSLILLTSLFWAVKLRAVNKQLWRLARTDPLTNIANRASINERMEKEIER